VRGRCGPAQGCEQSRHVKRPQAQVRGALRVCQQPGRGAVVCHRTRIQHVSKSASRAICVSCSATKQGRPATSQARKNPLEGLAALGVKVGRRLVEHHQRRLANQGRRQRQPLLLTSGKGHRITPPQLPQTHRLKDAADRLGHVFSGHPKVLQRERDLGLHTAGQQLALEVLEDLTDEVRQAMDGDARDVVAEQADRAVEITVLELPEPPR